MHYQPNSQVRHGKRRGSKLEALLLAVVGVHQIDTNPIRMGIEYTRRLFRLATESLPVEIDPSRDERSRTVMVVYGRDSALTESIFALLRALRLNPIEWETGVQETGSTSPYVGQVLDAMFKSAQAVIVVLSGDDEAQLREHLRHEADPDYESRLTPQARPNVIFEAGIAFGTNPDRTIIVEVGKLRPFSDIHGRHTIRFDGSEQKRKDLATRLGSAGCTIDLSDDAYLTIQLPYDFNALPKSAIPPLVVNPVVEERVEPTREVGWLSYGPNLIEEIGPFYGGSGEPADIPAHSRTFDEDDDEFVKGLVRRIPGCENLSSATVAQGIVIGDREPFGPQTFPLSRKAIYVSSQSRVVVRFSPEGMHLLYDLARSLAAPYYIARALVRRFDASPMYHFGFGYRITDAYPEGMLPGPTYQDYFTADVRRPFAESAFDSVLKCFRGGSMGTQKREDIRNTLNGFWTENFGQV